MNPERSSAQHRTSHVFSVDIVGHVFFGDNLGIRFHAFEIMFARDIIFSYDKFLPSSNLGVNRACQ